MKKPAILITGAVVCAALIFSACQKETSQAREEKVSASSNIPHATGAIADDPVKVNSIPSIVSSDFMNNLDKSAANLVSGKSPRPVKPGADGIAPTVAITSPANGATISGSSVVSISASDNVGINIISLSLDGVVVGSAGYSPASISLSATIADGNHTLTAKATDGAGNFSTHSILVTKNNTIVTLPASNLPSSISLQTPPIVNQGGEGSCAVFATTYEARSIDYFYKTKATTYSNSTNIFSPEFVYNQTKVLDCGSGTGLTTALDFMMTTGVCTFQSMPYSSSNGCSLMPTSSQLTEAANYKIASYSRVYTSDITTIKTMVVNKHPVIITINPDQSFWDAQPGFIWKSFAAQPGISHNLVICGYDDAKHAYKVMNSWGVEWGDAGFGWIDYDFLPQAAYAYSYVIN
jgi:hypothetical protein